MDFGVFLCLDYCKTIARESANTGEGFGNVAEVFGEDVGVNLGNFDGRLPQELLDLDQMHSGADKIAGLRMPQGMQLQIAGDPDFAQVMFEKVRDPASAEVEGFRPG